MRWGHGMVAIALAGCNAAFDLQSTVLADADMRPDLDHDLIPDEMDPCIAPAADSTVDTDMDGTPNASDGCATLPPFGDMDGDGVGDGCDPFPTMPGDQTRCVMAFQDLSVTVALWQPRIGAKTIPFAVSKGFIIGPQNADIAAIEPILPPDGTTTLEMYLGSFADDVPFYFALVLSGGDNAISADDTMLNGDVACVIAATKTETKIGIIGGDQLFASLPEAPRTGDVYLQAIVQPGKAGPNIQCIAGFDTAAGGTAIGANGHFEGPLRRTALSVPGGGVVIPVIEIKHRDDQPQLPGT